MSTTLRLVVWDFDGTLADTRAAIVAAASEALVSHGYPAPSPRQVTSLVGLPIHELYRALARDPGDAAVTSLAEAHRSHFEANATTTTTVFEGIEALLGGLTDDGIPSAVATSRTQRTLLPLMEHLGIASHFAAVRTDDLAAAPKPAPDMVLEICAELAVDPTDALVVGDTAFDVEMGRRAGAVTCGVTWGNHDRDELGDADHVVDEVTDLAALLEELLG